MFCIRLISWVAITTVVISSVSAHKPRRTIFVGHDMSFAPMRFQPTGQSPMGIRAADFNNDGILDLAVANYGDSTTSILLGYGNGSFRSYETLSNGINAGPNGLAIADINKDHQLDIVVTNMNASNINVFFGYGDGKFSQPAIYFTGNKSRPAECALGDLNNDSILDLVVSSHHNGTLLVFIGTVSGTFEKPYELSTGKDAGPYFLVINDFNKDNHLDVAVGNGEGGLEGNNVGIFLGNGKGNFSEQKTYHIESDGPYALIDGDFNQDGKLDIVTANFDGNTTTLLLGDCDGTLKIQRNYQNGDGSLPYAIAKGDFNMDCFLDVIVANSGTDNIGIMLWNRRGEFLQPLIYPTGTGSHPVDIAVGDFNRDHRLDFISANRDHHGIGIFISTSS